MRPTLANGALVPQAVDLADRGVIEG